MTYRLSTQVLFLINCGTLYRRYEMFSLYRFHMHVFIWCPLGKTSYLGRSTDWETFSKPYRTHGEGKESVQGKKVSAIYKSKICLCDRNGLFLKNGFLFSIYSTATNVEIEVPVPSDATNPNIRTSMGSAAYSPERDAMVWKVKSFPGGKVITIQFQINSFFPCSLLFWSVLMCWSNPSYRNTCAEQNLVFLV